LVFSGMAETLRQKLTRVQTSIKEVEEAGQSMSMEDGIAYTRATLQRLYERERKLLRAIARASGRVPLFRSVGMRGGYSE
jgi:RNA polymerase-binding transcription factor DksA